MDLVWNALVNMWYLDRSTARGLMSCRGLFVFTHESRLGNAPAHTLFDRVSVGTQDCCGAPRSFRDYIVQVDDSDLPGGVDLTKLVG